MGRLNGQFERYCFTCKMWYEAPNKDTSLIACPVCGKQQRFAKCNRCGYEWKLHRTRYPDHCAGISCKSPYYNVVRTQDRTDNREQDSQGAKP